MLTNHLFPSGTTTVFADSLFQALGNRLPVPTATRWNSVFDAVRALNKFLESKRADLISCLQDYNSSASHAHKLQQFTQQDIDFFNEYEKVSSVNFVFSPFC